MSINKKIEDKVKELQQALIAQNTYFANINDAIRKLRKDRKTVASEIDVTNGRIQAFEAVLKENKDEVLEAEVVKE